MRIAYGCRDNVVSIPPHVELGRNRNTRPGLRFESFLSEKANGLINYEFLDEKNPSASRTLLRLHRALKMVALLLQKISSDKKEKMSKIAYDSYHECPMPAHHPWVIKKGLLSIYDQRKNRSIYR